jgi:hypothetical protein
MSEPVHIPPSGGEVPTPLTPLGATHAPSGELGENSAVAPSSISGEASIISTPSGGVPLYNDAPSAVAASMAVAPSPAIEATVHAPVIAASTPAVVAGIHEAKTDKISPPAIAANAFTPLTDATAHDLAAALESQKATATLHRPRSGGNDLVARKLVLRRDRWDSLLKLTNALRAQRGILATPAEVAAIVLDAGLNVILEESSQAAHTAFERAAIAPAAKTVPEAKAVSAAKATVAAPAAPVTAPRAFTNVELAALRRLIRGLPSQRSVQRTLGLWLGVNSRSEARRAAGEPQSQNPIPGNSVGVPIEDLRSLCRIFKVYDTANFAQNMKKDAAFFKEIREPKGERLGYELTSKGTTAGASFRLVTVTPPAAKKAKAAIKKTAKTQKPHAKTKAKAKRRARGR